MAKKKVRRKRVQSISIADTAVGLGMAHQMGLFDVITELMGGLESGDFSRAAARAGSTAQQKITLQSTVSAGLMGLVYGIGKSVMPASIKRSTGITAGNLRLRLF